MAKFGERLKELRISRRMSQEALANELGISKQAVSQYERGLRTPKDYEQIADFFNVDMDYLMGRSDKTTHLSIDRYSNLARVETQRVPLLGEIACGKPIIANQTFDAYVEVGTQIKCDFCLRAKGDSMIDARIHDGDVVFIKEQPEVENGEIAAVEIDGEATLKRFYAYENKIVLQAANPNYAPLIYVGNEIGEIHILGKAVAFQSDIK